MANILSKEIKASDDIEDTNPRISMKMAVFLAVLPTYLPIIAAMPSQSQKMSAIPTKTSAAARLMSR